LKAGGSGILLATAVLLGAGTAPAPPASSLRGTGGQVFVIPKGGWSPLVERARRDGLGFLVVAVALTLAVGRS